MSGGNFVEGWTLEQVAEVWLDILLASGFGYVEKEVEGKASYELISEKTEVFLH